MRTINVISNSVAIEEIGTTGDIQLTASGALKRAEVQELINYLTTHLRETKDEPGWGRDDWSV